MQEFRKKIRKFFINLGPGFISGAADDDPTAIATYTQAGAQFGYGQLWTAVFSFPFMVVIQEMISVVLEQADGSRSGTAQQTSTAISLHHKEQAEVRTYHI